MTGFKRAAFRVTVFILAALFCAYIALLMTVNSALFQRWLKDQLAERTGYEVAASHLRLDPVLRLIATGVTAAKAGKPVLEAERVEMILSPFALISQSIHHLRLIKPTLRLEVDELFQTAKEPSVDISIRHLKIEDGALVLTFGSGNSVDFQSLALDAKNLNLAESTDLDLSADVPLLNGVAKVVFTGDESGKRATLRIEQPQSKGLQNLLQPKGPATAVLHAEIKLSRKDDEPPRLSATGKLDGMALGKDKFSGHFDLHGGLAADGEAADVAARFVMTEMPSRPEFLPIALPDGTSTLELEGKFLIADKKLALRSVRLQSPLGKADVSGELVFSPEIVRAAGRISISQGRFASLDGTRVGENLALAGQVETTIHQDSKEISIDGKLNIEQGEMLWGKFFGDLKIQRPALEFNGDYMSGADTLRVRQVSVALASVGKISARGNIDQTSSNPLFHLEIKSDDIQPAAFFEYFIRHTLNRSFPVLDQLALGGRLVFAALANGTFDNLSLEGAMQVRGGEVQNKVKQWSIGPVDLDLPLRLEYPGTATPAMPGNIPAGTLVVESARLGSEVLPAVKTTLSLWNNALTFRQPIRLSIFGGILEISELAFGNIVGNPQGLSLSLETKNLQLDRLTEALGWYRFGGTLSGSIPRIEWESGSLRSQGRIDVRVFGGRVQISELKVEDPFSSVPSIRLDARFRNIDLEQASRTFAFGRISGILEGTVDGLVVTAGQAAQFRADVHSVENSGVSQRISVESLNKLTVLSSGNDAGALYGGIAGFFDSFRYSKLGFKAVLRNDKLTLQGVESREDGEYLVVGSFLPPTVNVVSHTQTIAFSELLRRLERIQQSGKEKTGN
jgi:hypothetical protein